MKKNQVGKLPPRYKFILNPYADTRVSKCPICRHLTHMRKFALLIHIEQWGLLALGKTCRYCSLCELIVCHQDELEVELVGVFERVKPEIIGNPYHVGGTVDIRQWKKSLDSPGTPLTEMLEHVAQFKKVLSLQIESRWQPVSLTASRRKRPRKR